MGNRSRTPLTVGVLILALCALVAASGSGLGRLDLDRDRAAQGTTLDGDSDAPEDGDGERTPVGEAERSERPEPPRAWVLPARVVALLLLTVLGLASLAVLSQLRLTLARRRLRAGEPRVPVRLPRGEDGADDEDEEDGALGEALDAGLGELRSGPPRNAIVAAWSRLETATESARFHRDPADTPSEFVARVLTSYSLDADAIERLAALYREARFSEHSLGEAERDEARTCLQTLLAGLHRTAAPGGRA